MIDALPDNDMPTTLLGLRGAVFARPVLLCARSLYYPILERKGICCA